MKHLKKAGVSNNEISDLSRGKWSTKDKLSYLDIVYGDFLTKENIPTRIRLAPIRYSVILGKFTIKTPAMINTTPIQLHLNFIDSLLYIHLRLFISRKC